MSNIDYSILECSEKEGAKSHTRCDVPIVDYVCFRRKRLNRKFDGPDLIYSELAAPAH